MQLTAFRAVVVGELSVPQVIVPPAAELLPLMILPPAPTATQVVSPLASSTQLTPNRSWVTVLGTDSLPHVP
ncbi:MAG: hypothetical protein LC798_07385 [Chloroflexi bacterium]|nr:hypothetical protein [Chloroflexota bacterium]